MSPYATYNLFQSERPRTETEIREAEALLGELALTTHLIGRRFSLPARALVTRARSRAASTGDVHHAVERTPGAERDRLGHGDARRHPLQR